MNQLPHSADIEKAVLGAILWDNSDELVTDAIAKGLRPDDFYIEQHRRVYRRMIQLAQAGKPVEIVALVNAMVDPGELQATGGLSYLSDLHQDTIRRKSLDAQIDTILEASRRRELYRLCERTSAMVLDRTEPTAKCFEDHDDGRLEIASDSARFQIAKFADYSEQAWQRMVDRKNKPSGFSTGLGYYDKLTTGLQKGEVTVLGGRTGEGKSCFASQIAREISKRGIPFGFISPEMSKWQIMYRMWCHESAVDPGHIREPKYLTVPESVALEEAFGHVSEWPVYVDDRSGITAAEMAASVRLMVRRFKVEAVAIDYIQLIQAPGESEQERITAVSRQLMTLKKELNIAILALSQLRRPPVGDPNQRPNKYSFKESGSIENDADTVAAIYRPVDDDNQFIPSTEEIDILKQREGKTGIVPVWFNENRLLFGAR